MRCYVVFRTRDSFVIRFGIDVLSRTNDKLQVVNVIRAYAYVTVPRTLGRLYVIAASVPHTANSRDSRPRAYARVRLGISRSLPGTVYGIRYIAVTARRPRKPRVLSDTRPGGGGVEGSRSVNVDGAKPQGESNRYGIGPEDFSGKTKNTTNLWERNAWNVLWPFYLSYGTSA